ncbi:signal transduction histidine kinase [Ilumatobacter fluminis]|uniref:Signal transduction histidine kinase n=1 Tax=Ilumatobacter fluminis TaxID=467091 RepID=A0A4R7I229_9ACTN|nr:ATP-binding protein [Ilumatobacter fluminis]TDT16676.1 signal transduction histidine kinase [Ilumatobacter fluminis]
MPHTPTLYPTGRTVLRALVIARWLALAWMIGIVVFDHGELRHPAVAWVAVIATFALTAASTWLVRTAPERLAGTTFVSCEVALALSLSMIDGYVFEPGHVFGTTQSIATQWPLLAMASAGVAFGPVIAALLGALVGPAEWIGAILNGFDVFVPRQIVSFVATSIFFAAVGYVVGWLARQLRAVEGEIADRRARDEVGRVLHDTVLQTLALVQRRTSSTDPDLADAARRADRDLRAYLFGASSRSTADLESRVRTEVERARTGHTTPVTVSVLDDGCRLDEHAQDLVARAIAESVANALEHAEASRVVVFVESQPDGHVFASVSDDGVGFDPGAPRTSHGLDRSVIGRLEEIGGAVELTSSSEGTEVCLWSRADARGSST